MIVALAMPPPSHIVSRPIVPSSASRLLSSVVMIRAPVIPNGPESLKLITDGDADSSDGCFVELAPEPQWIQIDLEGEFNIGHLMGYDAVAVHANVESKNFLPRNPGSWPPIPQQERGGRVPAAELGVMGPDPAARTGRPCFPAAARVSVMPATSDPRSRDA